MTTGGGPPLALQARELDVAYDTTAVVVRGARLSISPGEFVAVVGENGAGKTSLLRALVGLITPSSGEVSVFGHPVDSVEARRDLAFVGDSPVFYDGISVGENLDFVARLHGLVALTASPEVHRLGVDQLLDQLPTRLSRGQRQRVHLAIGLARPWRLAVLDEPLSGLDPGSQADLVGLLTECCRTGRAVLVSTHDQALVSAADRAVRMVDGHLQVLGGADSDAVPR